MKTLENRMHTKSETKLRNAQKKTQRSYRDGKEEEEGTKRTNFLVYRSLRKRSFLLRVYMDDMFAYIPSFLLHFLL